MLRRLAHAAGSPVFLCACVLVLATGHWYDFNEDWWTYIDRAVYLLTLYLAVIVQHAQNHDTKALHAKLDELIRAIDKADDRLRGIEEK